MLIIIPSDFHRTNQCIVYTPSLSNNPMNSVAYVLSFHLRADLTVQRYQALRDIYPKREKDYKL